MTRAEAAQILGVAVFGVPGGNPHTCLYGAGLPTADQLFVSVSYGANARVEIPGSPNRHPSFIPVAVRGLTAYWLPTPEQQLGLDTPPPHGGGDLTVVDKGDLVSVSVDGAGTNQETTAIAAMKMVLSRL